MAKTYHKKNFFKHTFCIFTEVPITQIQGKTPCYTSKSGSLYYYTDKGVYRKANHWGRAANCRWVLERTTDMPEKNMVAFALWQAFYPDSTTLPVYFIEMRANKPAYNHKNAPTYTKDAFLRTAMQTKKRIQEIQKIQTQTTWAKYIAMDIDTAREILIKKLITTDIPLLTLRKALIENQNTI